MSTDLFRGRSGIWGAGRAVILYHFRSPVSVPKMGPDSHHMEEEIKEAAAACFIVRETSPLGAGILTTRSLT